MKQGKFSHSFVLTENFFQDGNAEGNTHVKDDHFAQKVQKLLEGSPKDCAEEGNQIEVLKQELSILKNRLSRAEEENQFLRSRKNKDATSLCLHCTGCKNNLCGGSNVIKVIDFEDSHQNCQRNARDGKRWFLSAGCMKDNIIVGSAKDALILNEVFYASSLFCNACLVEVGYAFKRQETPTAVQSIISDLCIFKCVDFKLDEQV